MKTNTIIIGTHNGLAHADETTAIALRIIFLNETHSYIRTRDSELLSECDILIDVGMQFDGLTKFDHHQYRHGKSAAGLTWDYIQEKLDISGKYPELDKLMSIVDKADTGEEESPSFSIPFIVSTMNDEHPFSEDQEIAFQKMIDFMVDILSSIKKVQDDAYLAESIIRNTAKSSITRSGKNVLVFEEGMVPSWNRVIHGDNEEFSHISIVVWLSESPLLNQRL